MDSDEPDDEVNCSRCTGSAEPDMACESCAEPCCPDCLFACRDPGFDPATDEPAVLCRHCMTDPL